MSQHHPLDLLYSCTGEGSVSHAPTPLCPNLSSVYAPIGVQLQPSHLVHMAVIFLVVRWVLWDLQKTRNKKDRLKLPSGKVMALNNHTCRALCNCSPSVLH